MIRRYSTARQRIRARIRAKVVGTSERPRLSVFRSSKHIYAQLIDDQQGITLCAANDLAPDMKGSKTERARAVGALLAQRAKESKAVTTNAVVFDRGGYRYHGRVKALADGSREGGLEF